MKRQGALLLDLGTDSQLSDSLQTIIEPYFGVYVGRLSYVHADELPALRSDLGRLVNSADPKIIFIVLPPDLETHHQSRIESIREEAREVPVIAVIAPATCEPQQVFQLLKAGAADFITSPFT